MKTATDRADSVAPCISDLASLIGTGVSPVQIPAIEVIVSSARSLQPVKCFIARK